MFTETDSRDRQRSDRRHSISSWVGVYAFYFTVLQLRVGFYWLFWKKLDVHVAVHRAKFLIIEPTRCTNFSKCLFWNETLHVSDSSSVHHQEFFYCTQQWYMSYSFADSLWAAANAPAHKPSAKLYDIFHCCVYSKKTPDDGQRNSPKHVEFHSKIKILRNSCIYLVLL